MKRTVLIPILLSTFFLVGCETETEFDRCFEANGGNAEFDKALYDEKNKARSLPEDTQREDILEVFEKQERIFKSSLTASELEFRSCGRKKYSERDKELEDMGFKDFSERMNKIDNDEITNLCLPKNRAKQICNSQGIY